MFDFLDFFRELNTQSVILRIALAVFCGGVIGIERELKHRAAGFRTHILICLGASLTTLTSQYLSLCAGYSTDVARLGAQVISGIGFIGAGAIVVTKRNRIKGLTTAAGLWTSAIIGLACGAGFAECAVFATAIILIAELLLIKIEDLITENTRESVIYLEYRGNQDLGGILRFIRESGIEIRDLEISKSGEKDSGYCAMVTARAKRRSLRGNIVGKISENPLVLAAEEM